MLKQSLPRALDDCKVSGIMICESPVMEGDARVMKKEYLKLVNGKKG